MGQDLSAFCNAILLECLNADKVEAIQVYLELYQIQQNLEKVKEYSLWNVLLILEYYKNIIKTANKSIIEDKGGMNQHEDDITLITREYILSMRVIMDRFFEIPFEFFKTSTPNDTNTNIIATYPDHQYLQYFPIILKTYLNNSEFPVAEQVGGEENKSRLLKYLTSWLIYHEIPDKYNLSRIIEYVKDLRRNLNNNNNYYNQRIINNNKGIEGAISDDDIVLQVLSNAWLNLSSNTLKLIMHCLT